MQKAIVVYYLADTKNNLSDIINFWKRNGRLPLRVICQVQVVVVQFIHLIFRK